MWPGATKPQHSLADVLWFIILLFVLKGLQQAPQSKEDLFAVFGILGYLFEQIVANQLLKMCLSFI